MSRQYHIIIGSKSFFNKQLPKNDDEYGITSTFSQIVRDSDESRNRGRAFENIADTLIVSNDSYTAITEQANDRIGALIEELTEDDAEIYVHNPPKNLQTYLNEVQKYGEITIEVKKQTYEIDKNESDFVDRMKSIATNIIGQNNAIVEVSKSMWYLTKTERKNPYVIMLFGNSSLGKTELVRELAKHFYNNEYFEKHLSMFKNNSYSDYFFGEKPNRVTLAYELLERNSNLIFLDELDKCPEYFYSAFYTLFDNVKFEDSTYEVETAGSLIILTSNYQNIEEMKKELGLPIFFRIDKFIEFNDFSIDTIYQIVQKEILDRSEEYSGLFIADDIYRAVCNRVNLTGENARTIKYKVQEVIEHLLFSRIEDDFSSEIL
ncbi:AAA family ATPase [Erysipelothrix anatis]|uniref:AAA family ATPase n=1 Tax=Erysipelothrix anatis TaxID=2683713 RepID=UPI00140C05D5|nr:AAA family ATPase [Erysipelothrix anatis]